VVFCGDRRHELRRRLAGASYAQIAGEGGGILSTVAATRAATEEEIAADTRRRLDEMLRCGTTTCEAKSGYGLTIDSELKQLRIHADELGASGGWQVAADLHVRSADHLLFVDTEGADALAKAGVVATLLPIASFYLKLGRFAPGRLLIAHGVAVALGTDVNPGGGFSPSMPFAMALACFGMGLTFEESLVAATINAA